MKYPIIGIKNCMIPKTNAAKSNFLILIFFSEIPLVALTVMASAAMDKETKIISKAFMISLKKGPDYQQGPLLFLYLTYSFGPRKVAITIAIALKPLAAPEMIAPYPSSLVVSL